MFQSGLEGTGTDGVSSGAAGGAGVSAGTSCGGGM